jgi:hypothetical protein
MVMELTKTKPMLELEKSQEIQDSGLANLEVRMMRAQALGAPSREVVNCDKEY